MVKINSLQIENIKRIKSVKLEPTSNGLTVIGGDNKQGKSSVLDSICFALGGQKFKPANPKRDDSVIPGTIKIELDNGIIVERKGKKSALTVTDSTGVKAGQSLLNEFVEQFALDLPRFMQSRNKAETLLHIIGVGEELADLERDEQAAYDSRRAMGHIKDQKQKFADELQYFPDVPDDIVSASELIERQEKILLKNAENQKLRENSEALEVKHTNALVQLKTLQIEIEALEKDLIIAKKDTADLKDECTEEIKKSLADIDSINAKVRTNLDKTKAVEEAKQYGIEYGQLTTRLEQIREDKSALLNGADLPLEGLTIEQGELTYKGQEWDCMSGSEQLIVATSIVRKLNPDMGFVLIDKLEQMDMATLQTFGHWLEAEELQCIATRVSQGSECSIIIEDGQISRETPKFKEGEF